MLLKFIQCQKNKKYNKIQKSHNCSNFSTFRDKLMRFAL